MHLLHSLRPALRTLVRDRTFSTLAVLMLAVGIAANATTFSVLDAVLLRPLPFPEPGQLVQFWETTPEGADFSASQPNFLDFRAQARTLESLAAYRDLAIDLVGQGEPQRLAGAAVTASFFAVLGVPAQRGRTFTEAEDAPGAPGRVVVLSDALWRGQFGASQTLLGSAINLNGAPHTVIGIMPPGFELPAADVWVPLAPSPAADRDDHWLSMVGRLRDGVSMAAAQTELAAIAARIGAEHPEIRGWSVHVEPLHDALRGQGLQRGVWALMIAVVLFLLLTCANLANLFLTRANARADESAVRAALGASRLNLVSPMIGEALLLACAGGALAVLLTAWSLDLLRGLAADQFPGIAGARLDARVLGFLLFATTAASALVSSIPALRAGQGDMHGLFKGGARTVGRRQSRIARELLTSAQVGLATILLLGAGLLLRSFMALDGVHPGFAADSLIAVPLELTSSRYTQEEWRQSVFFQQVAARVQELPGVQAAGASTTDPFHPFRFMNDVTPAERAAEVGPAGLLQADWRAVTRGYFQATHIPLLQGRLFAESDRFDAPRVAVISATLATRLWPGQNAVGKALYWGGTDGTPITVIGVVGDIRDVDLSQAAPPMLFLSTTQLSMPMMTLLVRSTGPLEAMTRALRSAIWEIDPTVPVPHVRRVADSRASALTRPRLQATLLSGFGALALFIAALGIYALVSFQVTSRTRELGIRSALGARPDQLNALVLGRTSLLVVTGLVLGVALTIPLAGAVRVLLFQTAPFDPLTILTVSGLLFAVALVAAWLPARRIARIDPLAALRME